MFCDSVNRPGEGSTGCSRSPRAPRCGWRISARHGLMVQSWADHDRIVLPVATECGHRRRTITAIGLDALPGPPRCQGRRDHLARDRARRELAVEVVPRHARFITGCAGPLRCSRRNSRWIARDRSVRHSLLTTECPSAGFLDQIVFARALYLVSCHARSPEPVKLQRGTSFAKPPIMQFEVYAQLALRSLPVVPFSARRSRLTNHSRCSAAGS
jgi:hypothetical protein